MSRLLLEIGTEEMPSGAIASAEQQLSRGVASVVSAARLGGGTIRSYATPRRLIVDVEDVHDRQSDQIRELRGPSLSIAYGPDGSPTGAAKGFARKAGVEVDALEKVSTDQGEYVLARVAEVGRLASDVLAEPLAEAVRTLVFPKLMRWGGGGMRFVRPIRWIVCLLDDIVIPVSIGGIEAGRVTRGHRFLGRMDIKIDSPESLISSLRSEWVEPDSGIRKEMIVNQANALAESVGGRIPWDPGLLDENVYLSEWPTAVLGAFDAKYLDLPRPVLVTAMKKHQRYFPVENEENALLPYFVAIRNGNDQHIDTVRQGYQRVLVARFDDAVYHYDQDKNTTLDQFSSELTRLQFQDKLGSMAMKRDRIVALVERLGILLDMDVTTVELAARAAYLCKADLVSRMVIELPALQGVIGREYAFRDGESPKVAFAIADHYLPKAAGDPVPESLVSRLVGLADRLDTLVGYVGQGIVPSGSSDPYGLRRAAMSAVQLIALNHNSPPLEILFNAALAGYRGQSLDIVVEETAVKELRVLFRQRVESILEDEGIRYDLAAAALDAGGDNDCGLSHQFARARFLESIADDAAFQYTVQTGSRLKNILTAATTKGVTIADNDESNLLTTEIETVLLRELPSSNDEILDRVAHMDFSGVYAKLKQWNARVNSFFNEVMVMADDDALRAQRLGLVRRINALYTSLADFTRVVTL